MVLGSEEFQDGNTDRFERLMRAWPPLPRERCMAMSSKGENSGSSCGERMEGEKCLSKFLPVLSQGQS